MMLGKLTPHFDKRTLKLSKYLSALAPPPPQSGYVDNVPTWPMFLNDSIGDCTIAAAAHILQQWTTYATKPFIPTDAQVLQAYEAVSGYRPNNPDSDRGAVMLNVLKYWKNKGIAGHKIIAYVSVNPLNINEVRQAIQLFGNCYIGVALPISAQTPKTGTNGKPLWSIPDASTGSDGNPGSWGGHCIPMVSYGIDPQGNTQSEIITWGQIYNMTWDFFQKYCDEAYAILTQDWIEANGQSPSGFNLSQLQTDLKQL